MERHASIHVSAPLSLDTHHQNGYLPRSPDDLVMNQLRSPLAIVDIETTGGNPLYHRIIDIAVIRMEEGKVVEEFESLVNPDRFVHPSITQLTGITTEQLEEAPSFRRIARSIHRLLDGALFVAHNARFDYNFLRYEFGRVRRPFTAKCLCTVKLSRKLYPEHRNHDLTSVISRMGLRCEHRHRAMSDAAVVRDFLDALEKREPATRVEQAIAAVLRTHALPPNIDREMIEALPEGPGVYLFYGSEGELLYVGRSRNIRERVFSHFTSGNERQMHNRVCRIEARRTAGLLGASLLELQLIKSLHPIYNRIGRRMRNLIAVRKEYSGAGYARAVTEEIEQIDFDTARPIMGIFKSFRQAEEYLQRITKEFRLCNKLMGFERGGGYCFSYHLHQCMGACNGDEGPESYNARFDRAFGERRLKAWPFKGPIMVEERLTDTEGEVFVFDQWCLMGSRRYTEFGEDNVESAAQLFDYDSYKVLRRYLDDPSRARRITSLPVGQTLIQP
jgi:DNA polymerase-3 subunit epsilon